MLVASNTSPISNLAIIGRLDLLQAQGGPPAPERYTRVKLKQLRLPWKFGPI